MKLLKYAICLAALAGCVSCIEDDHRLGGNLIPSDHLYSIHMTEFPIKDIEMRMADSLSGYSNTRITIGALRDETYGLVRRECALTIVPLYDTLDFGQVKEIKKFRLSAKFDTTSVAKTSDARILQRVYVNSLSKGCLIDKVPDANDINGIVKHESESIVKGSPILDGKSDLVLDFTEKYALEFLKNAQGKILSKDMEEYLKGFPGIYISTDEPEGLGGRINTFDLQMNYNSNYGYLEDNYGELSVSSVFEGSSEPVDTTFYFYYGALRYHNPDSLVRNVSAGQYPEYALNLSKHSTREKAGKTSEKVYIEGGAGLKPVITAKELKETISQIIKDTLSAHGMPESYIDKAIINKASIVLPFELPEDYDDITRLYPKRLSPTCKIVSEDAASYMGLTDASSESENQGDINRSICVYSPDVTYHIQQLIALEDDNESYLKGNYDIWFLLMNTFTTTTSSSSDNDMSEYLQYLAYQNYYNSMYGGYGYGSGYGYGGYGSSYYNNYYSYMMAAMYASGSTTTSTDFNLDQDLFYKATLCGPENKEHRPSVKLTFTVPSK